MPVIRARLALIYVATPSWSRSHSAVARMPSRTSIRAFQPSSRSAFSTDGQRRWTSTLKLGRCSSAKSAGSLPAASQHSAAISRDGQLVARRDVEVLVEPGRVPGRGDDPVGDVVDVRERPRLLAAAEDRQRGDAGERLADQVGHRVGDAGLGVGQLARAVGVERAADRVRQPVLVVRRAAVDLARQLGEAVGRERERAAVEVVLGRRELLRALEDHRGADVGEALDAVRPARRRTRRCRARCSRRSACTGACGSSRSRRRSPRGGSRASSRRSPRAPRRRSRRSPVWTSQPSRIHVGAARWSETRTSQSGSRSSRRTTAAPIVPAPPVTRTRFIGAAG